MVGSDQIGTGDDRHRVEGPGPTSKVHIIEFALLTVLVALAVGVFGVYRVFQRVEVEVYSQPDGARVYFIPADEYDSSRLNDPAYLSDYDTGAVTNDTVTQLERKYFVLFILGSERRLIPNVSIIEGEQNRVRANFYADTLR